MGVLHEHLLNKYFENQEQTGKVPKTWPVKNSQKIRLIEKFPKNQTHRKISQKLERLWKNKPYGACDGTWVRSGDNWKPINGNTGSKLTLKQWFACKYHKVGLEGMLFGRVGFFWGLNAKVTITALRVCGDEGSTPRSAWTLVVEWYKGSRASKIAINWGCDGIFVHLEKQDVLCGFAE